MYLGRIVELADKADAVRAAAPSVHAHAARRDSRHPHERPGAHAGAGRGAEPARTRRAGCTFNPRCPHANERCRVERPQLLADRRRPGRLPRGRGRADLSRCRSARRSSGSAGSRRSPRIRSASCSRSRISQASVAVDHHLGGARPRCCSCSPCSSHRRRRTARRRSRPAATASDAVAAEPVARFADRPDDVVAACGALGARSHSTIAIQASYIAGRTRSFIAASTMQKFLSLAGLQVRAPRSTSTPALPTSERPGSNRSLRWPWPRASMRASSRRDERRRRPAASRRRR